MKPAKAIALLTLGLALGTRAATAGPDDDFASQLGRIEAAALSDMGGLKISPVTQETGPDDPLLRMQAPLIALVKKVKPSVVLLSIGIGKETVLCTGFFTDTSKFLDKKSLIVTNSHCVENKAVGDEIEVGLYNGNDNYPKTTKGKILAFGDSAAAKDIALVELADPGLNRPGLPLWAKLDAGEQVVAIGNPHGLTFSVSLGIISALGRDFIGTDYFLDDNQADAAINPGSSGGPLFNMWGSVVGINTLFVSTTDGFEGISLSIPAAYIAEALKQYGRTGGLKIGYMQMKFGPDAQTQLLTVSQATPGGPADLAGIQAGDVLMKMDGTDLNSIPPHEAMRAVMAHTRYMSPGETVSLVWRRGKEDMTAQITLAKQSGEAPKWGKPNPNPKHEPPPRKPKRPRPKPKKNLAAL